MREPRVMIEMAVRKWTVDADSDEPPDRPPDEVYTGAIERLPLGQLGDVSQTLDVTRSVAIASAWLAANRETGDPAIVADMERALARHRQQIGDE